MSRFGKPDRGRFICVFILLLFLAAPSGLFAQEAWPLSADWVALRNFDWNNYQDIWGSGGLSRIDMVPDLSGEIAYYGSSPTSLFFRMTLRTTPVSGGALDRGGWFMVLDLNADNFLDWFIQLNGISRTLNTYPNTAGPDNTPDATPHFTLSNPVAAGFARTVPAGTAQYPNAVYLDVQIPLTALQKAGYASAVTYTTPFLMFYATNNNETVTARDILGTSTSLDLAFSQAMIYTPNLLRSFARISDTRDISPYSNQGIWYRGETVTVSGFRWPTSASPYYNAGQRNVRILNSSNTVVWSGVLSTTATGELLNTSLWAIGPSVPFGIYSIQVEHPRMPGIYYPYDTFEVNSPLMAVQKTTPTSTVTSGSNVSYTIQIQNTGNVAGMLTSIVDNLPAGFSYVSGSTTGLTTADPTVNGSQLTWQGSWSVPASGSVTLTFTAKATLVRGVYLNNVTISGTNFGVISTGPTAPVTVTAPVLALSKSVDKSSATPGDTLTYTVSYLNNGDGNASIVIILESIPVNTDYVTNSATGADMTVTYSHNGGISYDASQTPPVTNLSFQRSTALTPGSGASVSFKVTVK
ncbi:MAG: DUF11 domain-containing protein [Chitinispirillaceae bacterium]|nr:DUF11 domain-containing protein [Chitinispirillaceae bacterium]